MFSTSELYLLLDMQITLIGCGWLGLQLAEACVEQNYEVFGSTTQEINFERLKKVGVVPFIFSDTVIQLPEKALESEFFVISIPPSKSQNYLRLIDQLLSQINSNARVIYTSSTGVYLNNDGVVYEDGAINQSSVLAQAEALVLQHATNAIVLRLAGLIGPTRNPGKFTSGKTLASAQAPVNLVDGRDVVRFIQLLIHHKNAQGVYNLCFPDHPTKAAYYTQKCDELHLTPPDFTGQAEQGKKIDSKRTFEELGFQYWHTI